MRKWRKVMERCPEVFWALNGEGTADHVCERREKVNEHEEVVMASDEVMEA